MKPVFSEFRPRNYSAEYESHTLPRERASAHPLSAPPPPPPLAQVDVVDCGNTGFFDPLRGTDNDANAAAPDRDNLNEAVDHQPTREWTSFRRLLMQRFPVSKMVSVSSYARNLQQICTWRNWMIHKNLQLRVSRRLLGRKLGLMKNQQDLESVSCVSIILHHLLKEFPIEVVSSSVVQILHLIEFSKDNSFDQHMDYRLLGFRLYERKSLGDVVSAVLNKNQMDNHLSTIWEGVSRRAWNKGVTEVTGDCLFAHP
ncbi:hypothetical protein CR513_59080, partial [Mucuna pruriens]